MSDSILSRYFQQRANKRVTLLSNDRNLCIKVMVHDMESISAEATAKMESLLNRIAPNHKTVPAPDTCKSKKKSRKRKSKQQTAPIPQAQHEDCVSIRFTN